ASAVILRSVSLTMCWRWWFHKGHISTISSPGTKMFRRRDSAEALTALATQAVSANIMVADDKFNIVYVNNSVMALLRQAEANLKKDLPQFSVDKLIGTNIDVFHKNPSHQRQMLQSLKSVHRATIKIGNWSFDLVATPLKHADGSRAGTAVEWADASIRLPNLNFAAHSPP